MSVVASPISDASPRLQARRDHRRGLIIRGATAVFLEKGFHGSSMDAVAAATGMTKPTLYNYFRSKEDLFKDILGEAAQKMARMAERLAHGDGCYEQLVALGRIYTDIISEPDTIGIVRLVSAIAFEKPDLAQYYYELAHQIINSAFRATIDAQVDAGHLDIIDRDLAVDHFRALVVTPHYMSVFFHDPEVVKKSRREQMIATGARAFIKIYGTEAALADLGRRNLEAKLRG